MFLYLLFGFYGDGVKVRLRLGTNVHVFADFSKPHHKDSVWDLVKRIEVRDKLFWLHPLLFEEKGKSVLACKFA